MKNKEMFNRLVENGLDFLSKAITELKDNKQPQYSVINFYTAVELFVKARLMQEHWSLVITKRQEPDWEKFVNGDFQSVTLSEAADRLSKIVRSGLLEDELKAFSAVRNHRNKMVHFYHAATTDAENETLKQTIAKQQLQAWYFLHKRLTLHWKDVFSDWKVEMDAIGTSLRKHHEFLQVVYDDLKPKIESLKKTGIQFEECASCAFEAAQHHNIENTLTYESKCLVCEIREECLKIECPDCHKIVIFKAECSARCSCGKCLESDDVANILLENSFTTYNVKNGEDASNHIGNCSECDGFQTVV
ncbi:MAG: hypothetical protein OEX82_07890, partial [Nitrosomonas sp.]|nr:hypothetical protein [Nitrosomonas sp.]